MNRRVSSLAHAYYCDTRALNAAHLGAMLPLLSSGERARHDRLGFARDRRDYAAAHALLRVALAVHTNATPEELVFEADARGKPFLVRSGAPSFSLAHSRGLVACAIGWDMDVGIDVEAIDPSIHAITIAERFFSPGDVAALHDSSEEERPSRFCEMWTMKEARLKAAGAGLAGSLQCDGNGWAFVSMDVLGTHKLAIAIRDARSEADGDRGSTVHDAPRVDAEIVLLSSTSADKAFTTDVGCSNSNYP